MKLPSTWERNKRHYLWMVFMLVMGFQSIIPTTLQAQDVEDPEITAILTIPPSACDEPNGSIRVVATGDMAIQFSIDNGLTWHDTPNFVGLGVGWYTIKVRNHNQTGTVATGFEKLEVDGGITLSTEPNVTIPTNCGDADGSIILSATGGLDTYEYSIDNGVSWQTDGTFANLAEGAYQTLIRNAVDSSCLFNAGTIWVEPAKPSPFSISANMPNCGQDNGTISIQPMDNLTLAYSIDNGMTWSTSSDFANLPKGTYQILIRDEDNLCITAYENNPLQLWPEQAPVVTEVRTTNPSSCTVSDGAISLLTDGGTYEYSFDNGTTWQADSFATNLVYDDYTILVRNIDETCPIEAGVVRLIPDDLPAITTITPTHPSDCQATDGQLVVAATGNADLAYSIDNGTTWDTNNTFTNLSAGDYMINVQYADGTCTLTPQTLRLNEPSAPTISTIKAASPSDCGATDAIVEIETTDGEGLLQYSIDGGTTWQRDPIFTGLTAGKYVFAVSNEDNTCIITSDTTVVAALLQPTIDTVRVLDISDCDVSDGSIEIKTIGGNEVLDYSIDGGTTWQKSATFTALTPDDYQVAVRNADETCLANDNNTYTVKSPTPPVISATLSESISECSNTSGTIFIIANGEMDTQYSIDGGTTWFLTGAFDTLSAGDYKVMVRNSDGTCEVTGETVALSMPETMIEVTQIAVEQPTCDDNNGVIDIQATGGSDTLEYSINGGLSWQRTALYNQVAPGTYDIQVRSVGGNCFYENQVTLIEPVRAVIDSIQTETPVCGATNGVIRVFASGGVGALSYSVNGIDWQNTSVFANLSPNNYTVMVRNENADCEVSIAPTALSDIEIPEIVAVRSSDISDCGETLGRIEIALNTNAIPVEYSVDGGNTWGDSPIIENLQVGTYQIVIRRSDAPCQVAGEAVEIKQSTDVVVNAITPIYNGDCNNPSVDLAISAADTYEYSIDGGANWSTTISDLDIGNYVLRARDLNQSCYKIIDTLAINALITEVPTLQRLDKENSSCEVAGNITIVAQGSETIEYSIDGVTWQSDTLFENVAVGTYTPTFRYENATCFVTTDELTITGISGPEIQQVQITNAQTCATADGVIEIMAIGEADLEYSLNGSEWQNSGRFEQLTGGIYTGYIRYADASCTLTLDTLTVQAPEQANVKDIYVQNINECTGTTGQIEIVLTDTLTTNLLYSIDNGTTWSATALFENVAAGSYETKVRNIDSTCVVDAGNVEVLFEAAPTLSDVIIRYAADCGEADASIIIAANGEALEYSLDNGATWQNDNVFTGQKAGVYNAVVRTFGGDCVVAYANNPLEIANTATPEIDTVLTTNLTDCGTADASISIQLMNGTTDEFEYSIDNGTTWSLEPKFDDLLADTFQIQVRNRLGRCDVVYNQNPVITIGDNSIFEIENIMTTSPTRCDRDNGIVQLFISHDNVSYSIDDGATWSPTGTFTRLPAGVYYPVIRDDNMGCMASANPVRLYANEAILPTDVITIDPSICNGNAGSITFIANSTEVQYSVDGGTTWQASNQFMNLNSGTYDLRIRKSDETCEIELDPISLEEEEALAFTSIVPIVPSACTSSNGSIELDANYEDGTIEYSLDGVTWQTVGIFNNLPNGYYYPQVRTLNRSCHINSPMIALLSADAVEISSIQANAATDCNTEDGSIILATFDTMAVEYSLDGTNWQSEALFTVMPGDYNAYVRQIENECVLPYENNPISIDGAVFVTIDSLAISAATCDNQQGEIAIITTTCADEILEYSIDGGENWQDSNVFKTLAVGGYEAQVRSTADTMTMTTSPFNIAAAFGCTDTIMMQDTIVFDTMMMCIDSDRIDLPNGPGSVSICGNPVMLDISPMGDTCIEVSLIETFQGVDTICLVFCDSLDMTICDTTLLVVQMDNMPDTTSCPDLFNGIEEVVILENCTDTATVLLPIDPLAYTIELNGLEGSLLTHNTDSAAIELLFGTNEIILTNTDTTCIDTLMIEVGCNLEDCGLFDIGVITLDTEDCNAMGELCLNIPLTDINDYQFRVDGFFTLADRCDSQLDTAIASLDIPTGVHEVEILNLNNNCREVVTVVVNCPLFATEVTDTITTRVGERITICMADLNLDTMNIDTIRLACEDRATGVVTPILNEQDYCLMLTGTEVGTDTTCVELCVNDTTCVTATIITRVLNACEDLVEIEAVGGGMDCETQEVGRLCLPFNFSELNQYNIYIDNDLYDGERGVCQRDSLYEYNSSVVTAWGDGPYNLNSWRINEMQFTGMFNTLDDLVDSMNIWDMEAVWELTGTSIMGGSTVNTYDTLTISHVATGAQANLLLNAQFVPISTSIDLEVGLHTLVLERMTDGCTDTLSATMDCLGTIVFNDTIMMNEIDTFCLDTSELRSTFIRVENVCPEESGEIAIFTIDEETLCVSYEGFEEGRAGACYIVCDDLGICDTTMINLVVGMPPVDTTMMDTTIVDTMIIDSLQLVAMDDMITILLEENTIINVLANDSIPGNVLESFGIVTQPMLGVALFNEDGTLNYSPIGMTCDTTDVFSYEICNEMTCDTASISIEISCTQNLEVFDGFSPNGDGINDTFVIEGVEFYPNNNLKIFNRWGNLVYEKEVYNNDWGGTFVDSPLPDGTYYYLFNTGEGEVLQGFVELRR